MKTLLIGLLALSALTLQSVAQHAALGTIWQSTDHTNVAGFATNVAVRLDCNRHQYISIEVDVGLTNASAGTIDIVWQLGNTTTTAGENAPALAWFSVPLTNAGTVVSWCTNIDVGPARYLTVPWITNKSVQHITNANVKAYIKLLR